MRFGQNGNNAARVFGGITFQDDGCWRPANRPKADGYCRTMIGGRFVSIHRLMYISLIGPVPPGLELDHLCRNRWCCSPLHLEAVTHKVNMERGAHALKTHCPQGHPYDEANTYVHRGERQCKRCLYLRCKAAYVARAGERYKPQYTDEQVAEFRRLLASGLRPPAAGELVGIKKWSAYSIASGRVRAA